MLVLSRKTGETIHVGEAITLTVSKIAGNRVKLCISAPLECPVRRGESTPTPPTDRKTQTVKIPMGAVAR